MKKTLLENRRGKKKTRKIEVRDAAPYRYLIVCEGEETEPNYFQGIKDTINIKYRDKIDIIDRVELNIIGLGRSTEVLVNEAIKRRSLSKQPYGDVWVVFDKDDNSNEQFNNAIKLAAKQGVHTAWSNESIELWFVLHFEDLNTSISRERYISKLDNYFENKKIDKCEYRKNLPDIFKILQSNGSVVNAIRRSEKLIEFYKEQGIVNPSEMNPCTTVHELVKQLLDYVKED